MTGDDQPEMSTGESEAAELFHREEIARSHGEGVLTPASARADDPPRPPAHSAAPPAHSAAPPAHSAAPPAHSVAPQAPDAAPPTPRSDAFATRDRALPARRGKVKQVPRARRCPTCKLTFSGDSRFCPFDGDPLADAPDWNPAADPLVGRTIDGRYEVQAVVGEGGMGTVYEVRHKSLGRLFALKVLRRDIAQDAELVARFIQEAKAAAAIGHPNIVAVSDFGAIEVEPGQPELPFFVMEFLSGTSLASLLRTEKTLPAERVGEIMLQCAAALGAAHAAGVIHRDLKPDNVYLVRNGDQEFVKLLDFGVAKVTGGKRLTRIGMVFGTPHYMSPEQAEGKRIDARADVYALGVLMYECFAGRVPFEADTYMGVLTKHMYTAPEPLEQVVPDPSALGAFGPIVMRCLAKRPEERFASMADLSAAIELAMEAPCRAGTLVQEDPPRREPPELRERDDRLGPIQAPGGLVERLSMGARVAIALAAVVVPIAVALGVRALRAAAHEAQPPDALPVALEAKPPPPAEPPPAEPPPAAAPPPAPPAHQGAAPPAQEPPRPQASQAPPAASAAKPPAPTARPAATVAPAVRRHADGDIIDPWER
ncbi:uncharacterized protein SOCEGT47_034060 [Sorangium cellulosum]|uniref:non-specific serine/threonine protein kinase n=2 Tax=Sorangium cellulosum TaxID=56 RepID=A0A4P2Q150_SORCE|nr:uncharacterized protein SOCEGT47_034060 [Sorangium cellulosum]